ncbi:undecaprenyl-diphosphate phosphatase [Corticibacter populi]|uniref:Undecaprenyl-diphosphatase n=1 Tax=Corticibacter populi TaxID=1550736 RepID=A0A3M6QS22_9BURK|nr:undecaprenyl-diphosphate phosphatase [Corticibacter populi]RMX05783.1 undecaprenyl-diphosphate phosphatase [Corticibacter populi]RZS30911.1 undecaprenyl-diphosphatase [Corticibacter populi]
MSWIEAIILGLVQGLTEFLPISSSAHLRIIGPLLPSGGDPGAAFTAITQLGTEAAVLIYFRKDLWRIAQAWCGSLGRRHEAPGTDARMGWYIILGTVPIVVLGLLFKQAIEGSLRNLYLTATMLVVFALALALADRIGARTRPLQQLNGRHALLFGLAQAMALIPGVSRSGGTITGGLLLGYTREAAARYSFLLAIPAVLASGFYQLVRSWGQPDVSAFPTLLATLVAFGSGYGVIVVFLRWISHHSYLPFVLYRLALGVLVFVLLGLGVLKP